MAGHTRDVEAQRDRLLEVLRTHGTAFGELGRRFGSTMGLHTTDATALVAILEAQDRGRPLTQSELSHHVGLTTGATSSLLNRLEDAGHIRRARDSADRRVVTLHASEGIDAAVAQFFGPLTDRATALMQRYRPEVLTEFERFLGEYCSTMSAYIKDIEAQERPRPSE